MWTPQNSAKIAAEPTSETITLFCTVCNKRATSGGHFLERTQDPTTVKTQPLCGGYSALTHTRHCIQRIPGVPGPLRGECFNRGREVYVRRTHAAVRGTQPGAYRHCCLGPLQLTAREHRVHAARPAATHEAAQRLSPNPSRGRCGQHHQQTRRLSPATAYERCSLTSVRSSNESSPAASILSSRRFDIMFSRSMRVFSSDLGSSGARRSVNMTFARHRIAARIDCSNWTTKGRQEEVMVGSRPVADSMYVFCCR